MKVLAIIVNIFIPGVGTLIIGKVGQGIAQLLLFILAIVLNFTLVGAIVGVPLAIGVWIWAIVSAANANPEPMKVEITHRDDRQFSYPDRDDRYAAPRSTPPAPQADRYR